MEGLSYGQINIAIYLNVSVAQFLTLFSARTGDDWFWSDLPSLVLFIAACTSLKLSTVLACTWPSTTLNGVSVEGLSYSQPYLMPFQFIFGFIV
jgi:H+-transporting ATPase